MKIQIPDPIDFKQECLEAEKEIELIKNKIKAIEQTVSYPRALLAKNNLSPNGQMELADMELQLIDLQKELKAVKQMHTMKLQVVEETNLREAQLKAEYNIEYKTILRKALALKKDFRLPLELRNHLAQVLKEKDTFKNKNASIEQKTGYYKALKTEVQICNNYINNSK